MTKWSVLLVIAVALVAVEGFVENYVVGTPKVICAENDVALDVITAKPFEGNIFVKGRAKDAPCRQSYGANGTNTYSLPLGQCGMQRLRSANPRGISFAITVIVSFHPAGFITKNDRAFHIKCFYMEPDEIVTSAYEVSQIPTMELQDSMQMPTCEYSVHTGSPTGPAATYTNVGETVFHVWQCKGQDMGMLVKKCFVTDAEGEGHPVLDELGCTLDAFLLSEVKYEQNLMRAHATSQVFKYADSNNLFFTCQIRLCQKQMGMCDDVTPPQCGVARTKPAASVDNEMDVDNSSDATVARPKRQSLVNLHSIKTPPHTSVLKDIEIDVASPEMLILDHDQQKQVERAEFCISKVFLPLIPLVLLTVSCVSSSLTLVCWKSHCSVPKVIEF